MMFVSRSFHVRLALVVVVPIVACGRSAEPTDPTSADLSDAATPGPVGKGPASGCRKISATCEADSA